MTDRNAVANGVAWSLVRTWGSRLVGFFIYFQLARLLTPEDMGLFAASFAVLSLMELLIDLGMVQAIVQRPHVSEGLLNAVFALNLALAVLMASVLAVLAPWIESWVRAPGLEAIILVSSTALLFTTLGICQEALARKAIDFRLMATRTLVSTFISGVLGVWLAYAGYGVWALVVQFILASAINTATMWIRPRWFPSRAFDTKGLGQLLRFGLHVLGQRLVGYIDSRGVDLLLGALLGPSALGIFAVGAKLQYICMQLLGTALVDVAYPTFSKLQAEKEKLRDAHLTALRNVSMVSLPLWGLLAACAPEAVTVAFGPRWAASVPVLQAFAWIGCLQTLNQFDTPAFNALGRPDLSLRLGGLRAAAVFGAVLLVGEGATVTEAAWAIVAAQCAATPCYLYTLHKTLATSLGQWVRSVAPAIAGTLLLTMVVLFCRQHADWATSSIVFRFPLLVAVGTCTYLLFLALVARPQLTGLKRELLAFRRPA